MGSNSSRPKKLTPKRPHTDDDDQSGAERQEQPVGRRPSYWETLNLDMGNGAMITSGIILGYDVGIFGFMVGPLKDNFFHGSESYVWLGYSVSFLTRPIGGVLFGWLSDTLGRKPTSQITIVGLAVSIVLPTFLPSHFFMPRLEGFGTVAFIGCRALQGVMIGGDGAVRNTYSYETSSPGHEGVQYSMIYNGCAVATATVSVLTSITYSLAGKEGTNLYGWRLVFALGVVPCIASYYFRELMEESGELEEILAKKRAEAQEGGEGADDGLVAHFGQVVQYWPRLLLAILMEGIEMGVYSLFLFLPTQMILAGRSESSAYMLAGLSEVFGMFVWLAAGITSDFYGASRVVIAGTGLTALTAYHFFALALNPASMAIFVAYPLAMGLYHSASVAAPIYNASLFPTEIRGACNGLLLIVHPLVGGLSPMYVIWMGRMGCRNPMGVFVMGLNLLACGAAVAGTASGVQKDPPTWPEVRQQDGALPPTKAT